MSESVPVRCPVCRREHLYAAPSYPCVCGAPVAPVLNREAPPVAVAHRSWDDDWVTVRCGACGRLDQWPYPELGCPCGAVLRVPVGTAVASVPEDTEPETATDARSDTAATPRTDAGLGPRTGAAATPRADATSTPATDATADPGTHTAADPGTHTAADPGTDTIAPDPDPDATAGPRADNAAPQARDATADPGTDATATPGADGGAGQGRDGGAGLGTAPSTDLGVDLGTTPSAGPGSAPGTAMDDAPSPRPDSGVPARPDTGRLPKGVAAAARRRAFRPVAIRTARDAVTATALYLRWLGFRDIRRADQRQPSGISLAARGLLCQVEPTVVPTSLRDVECLWLTAMTESAGCVCFSLAGYSDEARSGADALGVPLFVLDLTGTPQAVNAPAHRMAVSGAD